MFVFCNVNCINLVVKVLVSFFRCFLRFIGSFLMKKIGKSLLVQMWSSLTEQRVDVLEKKICQIEALTGSQLVTSWSAGSVSAMIGSKSEKTNECKCHFDGSPSRFLNDTINVSLQVVASFHLDLFSKRISIITASLRGKEENKISLPIPAERSFMIVMRRKVDLFPFLFGNSNWTSSSIWQCQLKSKYSFGKTEKISSYLS